MRGCPSNLGDHKMYGMICLLIECGMMLEYMGSVDTGEGGITRGVSL